MSITTKQHSLSRSTAISSMRPGQTIDGSRICTGAPISGRVLGGLERTVRLGTFADGHRVIPLTAGYSQNVGSFGGVEYAR